MKPIPTTLALGATLLSLPCHADLFPNGDFSSAETSWEEVPTDNPDYVFSYPETGGNPGGFGIIDNSANNGGFGIWVADNGQIMSLTSLGLTAGETFIFSQDMIQQSGTNMGGVKVEFYNGTEGRGTTQDMKPASLNGGASWETYTFPVTIPEDADGIKVVPLWGAGSSIGFDNIQVATTPTTVEIINGDFSQSFTGWYQDGSADATTWSYPETGGNPGAYGVITNTGAGFGLWTTNYDQVLPLADLGLSAGDTALFQQDMILLSGDKIGGLKIKYYNGTNFVNETGDMEGTLIGDGSSWETYTFPVVIPDQIDGIPVTAIKIVPLWGAGSSVGYDNIGVVAQPAPLPATTAGVLVEGTIVSWTPTNTEKLHQPQRSFDGMAWADFGPAYPGTDTTSLLDPTSAPFYRITEVDPVGLSILINGDFETADFVDPNCAENWLCLANNGQEPSLYNLDSFSGSNSIRIAVQNDNTPTSNTSEIQQNLSNAGGFFTPGETYTLSFRAKQVSSGVSYVQQFRLSWLDENGPIANSGFVFTPFAGGNGTWEQIISPATTAPANATTALIQIFGATGAVSSTDAKGEVLLDNIELISGSPAEPTVLETTQTPGIGIYAQTQAGQLYQAEVTTDFNSVQTLSGVFEGNGEPVGAGTVREGDKRFYLLREVEGAAN